MICLAFLKSDSLQLSNASPDFSIGNSALCEFSKPVNWTLSIVGLETGSIKRFEDFGVPYCQNK